MNPVWYGRIQNVCMVVVVACVLLFDRVGGGYQTLIGVVAVLASIVSVTTYFYNQHLLRKEKDSTQP